MDGKWGYIDKNGELVISGIRYEPSDFTVGHARIHDDYYGSKAIDKTGTVYDDSLLVSNQMSGYDLVGTKNHLGSTVVNSYDANCIAWNSPNFWIYDYNGNLLQELSSNDILQGLSSDNIYTNGNLFRMLGADYDPLLETLSPYYGSCGMFGGDFSD